MELTDNNTRPERYSGQFSWGLNYMDGRNTKGSIGKAWWSGKYGSGRLFEQFILWEVKFRNV